MRLRADRQQWWPIPLLGWLSVVCLLPVLAVGLARILGFEWNVFAWAIAFTPYLIGSSVIALLLGLLARSLVPTLAALAVTAVTVGWQLPLFVPNDHPRTSGPAVTVLSSNLLKGRADVTQLVNIVSSQRVDLLATQEMTEEARQRLRSAGVEQHLPYGRVDDSGNGIWSRYPLVPEHSDGLALEWPTHGVRVRTPAGNLTFINVHPAAPLTPAHPKWSEDIPRLLDQLLPVTGPVIVAGDFNATLDHSVMRHLLAEGYRDAAEQAGVGINATWPVGRLPFPLFAIDHVLLRDTELAPIEVTTHTVSNTDHRAVLAKLATSPP